MNVQEFAALKVGDTVENHLHGQTGVGRVMEINAMGVYVSWGKDTVVRFFYSVNSTSWFHWSKSEDAAT